MNTPRHVVLTAVTATLVSGAACAEELDVRPTEGYLPRFSRTVEPSKRARVRLISDFPAGLAVSEWPVTFGVPFPRGALRSPGNVRIVTSEGREIPAQILRTATWHRPDGDVKWLLVDLAAKRGEEYFLEYGSEVQTRRVDSPLKIDDSGDRVIVDTGRIRVTFSRTHSHLIEGAWLTQGGEIRQVLRTRDRMSMIDHEGKRYETSDKPDDYQIEVETSGPCRVVVKATGRYRDESGSELCQYVTRAHLYARQSFIRIIHTFIVAFNTDKVQLRDIAVPFGLADIPVQQVVSPVETGFSASTESYGAPCRLVQDDVDHFSIKDGTGSVLHEGKRIGGWISVGGERTGISVGLRNMWQEHPKELEATPDGIVAHLWPRHTERLLDFRASGQLGPERFEDYNSRTYYRDFYKGGLGEYDQAFGLAKTNEMIVAFHGTDATEARSVCAALEAPPFLAATPEWMCKSDVFGPLHPHDPERFPDVEKKLDVAFERYEFLRDHIGNYGFFDYGDVDHQVKFSAKENRWITQPWRRMLSRFYGICVMPWTQFARTGQRRYLRWAIDNARHVMDIDMCHLTNTSEEIGRFPRYRGSRYGGNGGIIHYGHRPYVMGCDSHVSQWTYCYYLTGYRRAWDVLLEEGEYYLNRDVHYDPTKRPYYTRHTGGGMRTMTTLWNATWDQRYLEMARGLAKLCYTYAANEGKGLVRRDDVYMNAGLVTYYQATGDERMKELFLNCMRDINESRSPEGDERAYKFYGPAIAYYWTADPSLLRRSMFWTDQFLECLNVGDDPLWRGVPEGHWDACYNNIHLLYVPYLLGARSTLDKPVEPAADQSAGSTEIWLNNPDGRAFPVAVRWSCHAARGWGNYCKKHKPEGRLVVLDPDGNVAASSTIDFETYPSGTTVSMDVPPGKPGLYRAALEGTEAMRIKMILLSESVEQWAYPTAAGCVAYADAYYFHVPKDREEITVRFKVWATHVTPTAKLLDPTGRVVREAKLERANAPDVPWTTWREPVPTEARGKLWRFQVRPLHAKVTEVRLRIDGVPPLVSTTAKAFFLPERVPEIARPEPLPSPPGVTTPVRTIPAGEELRVPRGKQNGANRFVRLNGLAGTIELWMRPDWDPDETMYYASMGRFMPANDFLRCGELLARRTHPGIRLALDRAVIMSNMVLRPGVWHHLAVTWDFGAEKREHSFCFFVDGVRLGDLWKSLPDDGHDWSGEGVRIRSTTGPIHVTGLRISALSRHDELQKGLLSPPPDEDTLYYDQPE